MVFVSVGSSRARLEQLTQLLVCTFPGSTVYQHTDPLRAPHDVLNNKVDAVFLEAEMENTDGLGLMQMLQRQKPGVRVYIISNTEELRTRAAEAGANGYMVQPVSEQQLCGVMRTAV